MSRPLLLVSLLVVTLVCLSTVDGSRDPRKKEAQLWMKEKAKEEGVHKLKNGILLKILEKGKGMKSPKMHHDCEIFFTGYFIDGEEWDSSEVRVEGQPTTFKPADLFEGWQQALLMMREGDKWIVYIPYQLAYGHEGTNKRSTYIPPYAALYIEMELVKVKDQGRKYTRGIAELEEATGKKFDDL